MEKEKAEIASLVERYGRVQSLMKYVNSDTLKESYNKQPKGKAVGVDGITKEQYGENLEENIESLLVRMKKFSYKPYPVRRAYNPKGNGKMRGLGIPSFEDKVVQGVFKEILEAIYEPKFKEFSFGFRPNRSCHDAIQRVNKHIMADKVNYILDADIKGFFDNLDHEWMIKFLEHDIADKNFIRYIKRFLIGGVMEDGKRLDTEAGTVQGGLISPVLANVYLHYTLDTWFDYVKKHEFKGEMYMVRYADDFVCLFQYENEAQRFYQLLIERLRKFGLEIAEDKSRILPFGRYKGTKESFDFLGFTHYNVTSHWGKYCVLHRTSRKKLKMKREAVKKWLWEHMHESIADTIEALNVKLTGHYRYYGIYGNYIGLIKYFVYERERKMVKLSTLCYIEQDGKYLMLHRTVKENDINKDKWIGVGGHFEKGESPEECLLREVWEETGYTLTSWRYRGIVTFVYGEDVVEYMSLYTADGFTGTPIACDEGELEWVEKSKIGELELWEGDRIFFELLENKQPFFSLKLVYNTDDVLEYAALDGKEMKDFRRKEC